MKNKLATTGFEPVTFDKIGQIFRLKYVSLNSNNFFSWQLFSHFLCIFKTVLMRSFHCTVNFLTAKFAGFRCVHNPTALSLHILQSLITSNGSLHFGEVQFFPAIFTTFPLQLLLLFHCNFYHFPNAILLFFNYNICCFSTAFFETFSMPKIPLSNCILRKTKIFQKKNLIKNLAIFTTSS